MINKRLLTVEIDWLIIFCFTSPLRTFHSYGEPLGDIKIKTGHVNANLLLSTKD